jgi:hypothetical protein
MAVWNFTLLKVFHVALHFFQSVIFWNKNKVYYTPEYDIRIADSKT